MVGCKLGSNSISKTKCILKKRSMISTNVYWEGILSREERNRKMLHHGIWILDTGHYINQIFLQLDVKVYYFFWRHSKGNDVWMLIRRLGQWFFWCANLVGRWGREHVLLVNKKNIVKLNFTHRPENDQFCHSFHENFHS